MVSTTTATATTIPVPKYKSSTCSATITPFQLPTPKLPGKRPTVGAVGLESTVESIKRPINDIPDGKIRTGHIGDTTLKGDNGFYTKGFICNKPLDFLIDNGSTGSILSSRKYSELKNDLEPLVRPFNTSVYDASGNIIPSYGAVDVKISLGGCDFEQTMIICDIKQDGVIGQNFLLNYAENTLTTSMVELTLKSMKSIVG